MSDDRKNDTREQLRHQALVGFLSFLAFMSVIQAAINVVQPEPQMWPAVLALVLVITTVVVWRRGRK
ncbi:hypothetical protein HW450_04350 [Corynebacterium hindlerae]|uniref:Uncharacterized protein n=1 Tax=Corynebacterium hindlerae TaxID=699041 RepID=A0A7G5FH65_9CORY|nr:hypothetical protein [Corynebacterium hindlerae]QMV85956.1 hypothetical protein HW450_04350 [Corynebacterium hindlerae]QTH60393.1 hypothetical protein J5O04_04510 [Corynebacterium hindlerae]